MGQAGAGGVGQDLLDDGGHHSLVVAVAAARAAGGRDPQRGKKRLLGQSPAPSLLPASLYGSPWQEGSSLPDRTGAGTGLNHSGLVCS